MRQNKKTVHVITAIICGAKVYVKELTPRSNNVKLVASTTILLIQALQYDTVEEAEAALRKIDNPYAHGYHVEAMLIDAVDAMITPVTSQANSLQ